MIRKDAPFSAAMRHAFFRACVRLFAECDRATGKKIQKENPTYENRFDNRTVFGGRDFRCFWHEWVPALHPLSTARGLGRTIHERPVRLALPDGYHGGSGHRGGTSAGQPFRAIG